LELTQKFEEDELKYQSHLETMKEAEQQFSEMQQRQEDLQRELEFAEEALQEHEVLKKM
jgi:hypothetical protein